MAFPGKNLPILLIKAPYIVTPWRDTKFLVKRLLRKGHDLNACQFSSDPMNVCLHEVKFYERSNA